VAIVVIPRRRMVWTASLLMLATCAAACSSPGSTATTTSASPSTTSSGDSAETVRVLGLWSGPEYDSFDTVKSLWEKSTGNTVDWQGTQDVLDALEADDQAGTPADIAVLPNMAVMQRLAKDGKLIPLNSVLDMTQVANDYAPAWTGLGSYHGTLYGIFYKVSDKATVWYSPTAFAAGGYKAPRTWDDMTALADVMVSSGRTPFSVVSASGPASGWPLTDWISEIVLNNCGPDTYDKWVAAEIPWTDACIRESFEMFVKVVQTKGFVRGGTQGILTTTDGDGGTPLLTRPPTAYMYYLSSIAQGFIASQYPNLDAGDDYDYFPFPTIDPKYSGAITIGADVVVMLRDTPAARSFMTYLAGATAQESWIKLGGFTSVNRSVPPGTYLDPVGQAVAAEVTDASIVRFAAGDLMPASLQRAWWAGMLDLVQDPSKLDPILRSLTSAAKTAS
jgi:alpha-glucoside transport system substrate-binding protein